MIGFRSPTRPPRSDYNIVTPYSAYTADDSSLRSSSNSNTDSSSSAPPLLDTYTGDNPTDHCRLTSRTSRTRKMEYDDDFALQFADLVSANFDTKARAGEIAPSDFIEFKTETIGTSLDGTRTRTGKRTRTRI